jgi:predicted transcriptional regulator
MFVFMSFQRTLLFSIRSIEKTPKFFNCSYIPRRRVRIGDGIMSKLKFFTPFKYRDRVSIISDILKAVKDSPGKGKGKGKRKTQIMQSANLNYLQMKKYLNYLLNCGFLVLTEKETYVVTAEGSRFLRWQLAEIERLRRITI